MRETYRQTDRQTDGRTDRQREKVFGEAVDFERILNIFRF